MDYFSKENSRRVIARKTRDFLAAGGVIEIVPTVRVCPANMGWIAERGWDYMPWSRMGGPEFFSGQTVLDEGCYHTKPTKTEGD